MTRLLIFLAFDVRLIWIGGLTLAVFTQGWAGGSGRPAHVYAAGVRVHQELWLFTLPGLVIALAQSAERHDMMGIFSGAVAFGGWWWLRNWPDENVWKRRGRKARDAVKAAGHRLVVVPT